MSNAFLKANAHLLFDHHVVEEVLSQGKEWESVDHYASSGVVVETNTLTILSSHATRSQAESAAIQVQENA